MIRWTARTPCIATDRPTATVRGSGVVGDFPRLQLAYFAATQASLLTALRCRRTAVRCLVQQAVVVCLLTPVAPVRYSYLSSDYAVLQRCLALHCCTVEPCKKAEHSS